MGIKGNNKGFSLIEVLIATALVGVAAVGTTQLFVGQNRQMRNLQVKANVDQLRNVVQSAALNPNTILYSAGKMDSGALINPDLYKCVITTGVADTTKDCRDGAVFASQRVFAPDGHEVTGLYTSNGVRCADAASGAPTPTPGEMCPYKVSASFRATCPPASSGLTAGGLCARGQMVQIGWKIEQAYQPKNTPYMKPIETDFDNNKSAAYAVPVSVQSIQAVESAQVSCSPAPFTTAMLKSNGGPYDDTKYGNLVGQPFPQTVTSVDAYGQQLCGIDDGAVQAASLKTEVCKLWVQNVWNGLAPGGHVQSTTPTCDLKVVKNYKLALDAGARGYYTDECNLAANYRLYADATTYYTSPSQIYPMIGGQLYHLNGTPYASDEIGTLVTMYGINLSDSMDGRLTCKPPVTDTFYWPTPGDPNAIQRGNCAGGAPCNFVLPATFQPGSLYVALIGGGAGGNNANGKHKGGKGGNSGDTNSKNSNKDGDNYPNANPNDNCYIFVGGGGGGDGGWGGQSSFHCASNTPLNENGGTGGGDTGVNGGSDGGGDWYMAKYCSGGHASSNAGGAWDGGSCGGNGCGIGGGGGNHDNGANHTGGPGGHGCARLKYNTITWPAPWEPTPKH